MTAYVPRFVPQLDGSQFAGLNCSAAAGAMALDRETLGKHRTTGAKVRALTGDRKGGLRQSQVAFALDQGWDVTLDVENPTTTATALKRGDDGQAFMLAGQSAATRGTQWSASPTFGGNHQWIWLDRRKNSQVAGGWQWLIMDPLGDGRRPGIADFGPSGLWIPENLGLDFARRLNVSDDPDNSYVPLGFGKFYAVFTHDTEPHLVLRFGATEVKPIVVKTIRVAAGQKANCRSGPGKQYPVIDRYVNGSKFTWRQKTTKGQSLGGSAVWYGNVDGTRWLHSSAF